MYCILNMGWEPAKYTNLSQKERAMVIASVQIKLEEEKKANKRAKANRPHKRRR